MRQDYYNIVEVIVLDDGDDEPLQLKEIGIPIHYIQNMKRCSIGYKRNYGCNIAKGDYIAFMDTDDFYHSNYISNSIFDLRYHNKDVAGCADMILYKDHKYYILCCCFIHLLNEATLVFKKSYWTENRFSDTNSSEAVPFLEKNPDKIIETKPYMICLAHAHNTIDKNQWVKKELEIKLFFKLPKEVCDLMD